MISHEFENFRTAKVKLYSVNSKSFGLNSKNIPEMPKLPQIRAGTESAKYISALLK